MQQWVVVVATAVVLGACASPAEQRQASLDRAANSACFPHGTYRASEWQMSDRCIQAACARLPGDTLGWCPASLAEYRQSLRDHDCLTDDDMWSKAALQAAWDGREMCRTPAPNLPPEVAQAMQRWSTSPEAREFLLSNPDGRELLAGLGLR